MGFFCDNHSPKVSNIKPTIYVDISNIAGNDNGFMSKMKNINLMYNALKYEYWIIGIADWGLYSCIDYVESYKYYLGRRIIIIAPPGIEADRLLIICAVHDNCFIVTNDKFLDHMDIIPSKEWLESHRIPFDIKDGEFIVHLPK